VCGTIARGTGKKGRVAEKGCGFDTLTRPQKKRSMRGSRWDIVLKEFEAKKDNFHQREETSAPAGNGGSRVKLNVHELGVEGGLRPA